jgi:thiamine biosynthesis protein ThiS
VLVVVNGEKKDLSTNLSLQELVESLITASERVAVELNGLVVPRDAWGSTRLKDNDRIELVHFVGGGNKN